MGGPVWRIGDENGGPYQYGAAWFGPPDHPTPTYRVGTSELTDWPMLHPGPLNAGTGSTSHDATIVFDHPGTGSAAYELRIAVDASRGPCPQLLVTLNNHRGLWIIDPQRDNRAQTDYTSPIAGRAETSFTLPAGWFVDGENRIVLRTVALDEPDPDERHAPQPFFAPWYHFGSGITYRTVELWARDTTASAVPDVKVTPLPLYQQAEGGGLAELVDVVVRPSPGTSVTKAELRLDSHHAAIDLDSDGRSFGDIRARLAVPERSDPCSAEVDLVVDGQLHEFAFPFHPARKWTLHLLPHVHLDVGYTDFQGKVIELHSRNLDRAVAALEDHPGFAFSVDGSLVVDAYIGSRSEAATSRVLDALRDGRIATNAFSVLFLTGIASLEECYRAAYGSARLAREEGVPITYANLTDVPSYSWAIPSVLAALGIGEFLGVANHGRAATDDSDELHMLSPFRWRGPDGAEVVTFVADCYSQLRFLAADPPTVPGCVDGFTRFVRRYERDDYLPHDLPIVGIHADNEDMGCVESELVARWKATYAYPSLRYSTVADYFAAVRPLSDDLPVVAGDGGSYWEDGVGSQAEAIARYRRAQSDLLTAEALAASISLVDGDLRPVRGRLNDAWDALVLGAEHTWSSWHATNVPDSEQAVDQLDWKVHQIRSAARLARDELMRAASQLGERVAVDPPAVVVFNPLSWERSGSVEVELDAGMGLVTEDGTPLAGDALLALGGRTRVRLRMPPVAGFGTRAYALLPGFEWAVAAPEPVPEHFTVGAYDVTCERDTGRVVSLFHRPSAMELVDGSSRYGLAHVVYVSGGDAGADGADSHRGRTSLYNTAPYLPPPKLDEISATTETAEFVRRLASVVIRTRGWAPMLPVVETEVELYDDHDRVDVRVRLLKEATLAKESVYVAFPFAVADPALRYDRQQGWVNPAVDHQPGACNEWFTTQHCVELAGPQGAVTWVSADAPLFTVGDVVRGRWPRRFEGGSATLLSWVMNNYWWTNYPARQSGDVHLRYAFRPAAGADAATAARFGREVRAPLFASELTNLDRFGGSGARRLPRGGAPLLAINAPTNVVATLHGADDGHGVIVRLQETAGSRADAVIVHPDGAGGAAWRCRASEECLSSLMVDDGGEVTVTVKPFEVATVRLGPA